MSLDCLQAGMLSSIISTCSQHYCCQSYCSPRSEPYSLQITISGVCAHFDTPTLRVCSGLDRLLVHAMQLRTVLSRLTSWLRAVDLHARAELTCQRRMTTDVTAGMQTPESLTDTEHVVRQGNC